MRILLRLKDILLVYSVHRIDTMPRPVAVLTFEEIVARQARARELRRAKNKRYYENHIAYFKEFYQNDRERLCARASERTIRIYYEKKAAKAAAAAALPAPPIL